MSSLSRRLRRSVAAEGLDGARRRVAWLGVLAREARVPNAVLVGMIEQHPIAEVRRILKARRAELRRKAAARDAIRSSWETVETGGRMQVKISRVPRRTMGFAEAAVDQAIGPDVTVIDEAHCLPTAYDLASADIIVAGVPIEGFDENEIVEIEGQDGDKIL